MEATDEKFLPPTHEDNPHHVPLVLDQDFAEGMDVEDNVYAGVEAETYFDNPRMSRTPLSEAERSASHVHHRYEESKDSTKEMGLGTAVHAAVLEPQFYEDEYAISPQCCAETSSGSRCSANAAMRFTLPVEEVTDNDATPEEYETFAAQKGGEEVLMTQRWYCTQYGHAEKYGRIDGESIDADDAVAISEDQASKVRIMRKNLSEHTDARKYLWELEGVNEAALFWTDPKYGVPMKSRIDRFIYEDDEDVIEKVDEETGIVTEVGRPVLVDLKTTKDASLEAFQKQIGRLRYHFQAATYCRGASSLGWPRPKWVFVCVENKPPHEVATYKLKPETISTSENEVRSAMKEVAEAMDEDKWSGYPQHTREIAKPRWA